MSRLAKTIISLVSAGLVAVAGILLYVFWPAITGTINDNKYYTAEDVQNSYDKGFDDGNKSETELTAEITYYKTLVDDYEAEVNSLNKELGDLISVKSQNEATISNLTAIKNENEATISKLQTTVDENNESIANYTAQIASMNAQILALQNTNTNNQTEINSLRNQISNYQTIVNQLQNTNDMNVQTINSLNSQITSLNKQISELQFELNNNSTSVEELEKTIVELRKSIIYYESYIAELESEAQVVATFEFDGSVYNIQILNKGSNVSVVNPTSTEKVIFNGWTVNGQPVDLTNYTITANTKFVADITYKNLVTFKSNGENVKQEYIETGYFTSAPSVSQEGFDFDGWTVDGKTIVDVSTYEITKDTTFVAVYTQIHTVSFLYEEEIVSTQNIRNGEYATNVNVDSTVYKTFNGWTINGSIVDLSSYKISSSVVFTASITYSYDVNFIVNEEVYNSQIVTQNNYVIVPNNPEVKDYIFEGWTVNNELIDLTNYRITENTSIVAKMTYAPAGLFADDGSLLMTWDDMIANDYIALSETTEGYIKAGSNADRKTVEGHLKISDEVTGFDIVYNSNYGAFSGWTGLKSIEIPESVTKIADYTFYNCSSVETMYVRCSATWSSSTFSNMSSLKNLYIDDLAAWANNSQATYNSAMSYSKSFYYLDGDEYKYVETEFTVPDYVTNIKAGAFYGLPLTYLSIPDSVVSCANISVDKKNLTYLNFARFDQWVGFAGSLTLLDNPLYYLLELHIGGRLTSELSETEVHTMLQSATAIPGYSFVRNNNIKNLVIPSNIKTTYGYCFEECDGVTTLYVPDSVKTIGSSSFDFPNLTSIDLPFVGTTGTATTSASTTCFGAIFSSNTNCTKITQYYGSTSSKSRTSYIPSNLKKVNIRGGVRYGIGAFYGCSMIEEINVPPTIERLGDEAFYGCWGLKKFYFNAKNCVANDYNGIWCMAGRDSTGITVIIGKDVEVLNPYVFDGGNYALSTSVPNIKYIYFESGSKCTSIDDTFQYLDHLVGIYIPGSVTSIASYSFSFGGQFTIYCAAITKPSGFVDGWNWYESTSTYLPVHYGITLNTFLSAMGLV